MTETHEHAREIEELAKRYQQLSNAQVRAQTNLENAEKHLAELEADAKKQFGSSDVEDLKQQLNEIETENQKRKLEYEKHLVSIESKLAEVENSEQA